MSGSLSFRYSQFLGTELFAVISLKLELELRNIVRCVLYWSTHEDIIIITLRPQYNAQNAKYWDMLWIRNFQIQL